jgi:hypothetical protein
MNKELAADKRRWMGWLIGSGMYRAEAQRTQRSGEFYRLGSPAGIVGQVTKERDCGL